MALSIFRYTSLYDFHYCAYCERPMGLAKEGFTPGSMCLQCEMDILGMPPSELIYIPELYVGMEFPEIMEDVHKSFLDEVGPELSKRPALISGWLMCLEDIADALRTKQYYPGTKEVQRYIESGIIPAVKSSSPRQYICNMAWLDPDWSEVPEDKLSDYHPLDLCHGYPLPGAWTINLESAPYSVRDYSSPHVQSDD